MIFDYKESMMNLKADIEGLRQYCLKGYLIINAEFSMLSLNLSNVTSVGSAGFSSISSTGDSDKDKRMVCLITKYEKIICYYSSLVKAIAKSCNTDEKNFLMKQICEGKNYSELKKDYPNRDLSKIQDKIYRKILSMMPSYWVEWSNDTENIKYVKVDGFFTFVKLKNSSKKG